MKLWPTISLVLLMQSAGLRAQSVDERLKLGESALADELWEVAELHFQESFNDPALTQEARATAGIHLAEAMVRAGNADEALELLTQSTLADHPDAPFWKAQALILKHQFSQAAELLLGLLSKPESPHRIESAMSLASLYLALGQPEKSLAILSQISPEADSATAASLALYRVEILLDIDRTAEARATMPAKESVPLSFARHAMLLEAELFLREEMLSEAQALFHTLVSQPQGLNLHQYQTAAIGYAEALHARGSTDAASKFLLDFIQENPESNMLEAMFDRILAWMPESPTATDPALERLQTWITPHIKPAIGLIATRSSDAVAAWPTPSGYEAMSELLAASLYTRAMGLHRIQTPEAHAEATQLLNRLRFENPTHPLSNRALFQQAKWLLENGSPDRAFSLLETIRTVVGENRLKGSAALLEARTAYKNGDSERAIQLFDEAAHLLDGESSRAARLQSAIAKLRFGSVSKTIQQTSDPTDPSLATDLELERALSATPWTAKKSALTSFLEKSPNHPRAAEARLAAAEAALAEATPDLEFARAQLATIATDPGKIPLSRLAIANLRITDLAGDSAKTIAEAQAIIHTYPGDPITSEASLILGRNLFQSGSYNPARLIFENLAASDPDPARAQAVWILAARAAALGATPQSKEDAVILFDKAIKTKGPVTSIANLEMARHLIDIARLPEASALLKSWIKTLPETDPLQLPAGLLLGEALYAQGSNNPATLVQALAVYDKLIVHAKEHPALFNRLQYLRGTTLEQLPDEKNPLKKRESQAFQAYHSVLEIRTAPAEWEYFERCGFRALALLEKANRWEAAITVARKIASFKGPRAEEANNRAKEIQLEHVIWAD